ncbi:MAG: hypothetical protein RBS55_03515 [Bacteroidales bacterium]|jgi:hypothetical protein|nr:hypothetical protein [Bacteroidales bacterium]
MKFKITLNLFIYLNSIALNAQIESVIWQNCLGAENGQNWTYAAEKTDNGYLFGIYILNDGPGISNYHSGADAWIVNTDNYGNVIWERCYGGSSGDGPHKIIRIDSNNYYLFNHASSSDGDVHHFLGKDFWMVKIKANGEIVWEKNYGGSANGEIAVDAILMPDKGALMMGRISSSGGDVTHSYGDMDVWLCRIDSVGDIIWQKTIGNSGKDNGITIKLSSHNTILFIGGHELTGGMIDCPDYGYIFTDVWVVEMDLDGTTLNQWCYGGVYYDLGYDIIETNNGYVIAASTSSNDRDVSGYHGTPGVYEDIWALKIDLYGNIIWQKCLGGLTNEWPTYLTQTADSGFLLIGNTDSHDGDVTGNHTTEWHEMDIWVVKLNSNGQLLWEHCIGGLGTDRFWNIHSVYKKDDYNYVLGANSNYASGDVTCDLYPNDESENAWLLEIKDCDYYKPHVPVITSGPDTVCSTVTATSIYTIDTVKWATGYEWLLIPENAGTITSDSLSTEITWNITYEGTAELKARSTNDCGYSEWSETRCVRVHTCLGIEEEETGRPGDKETGRGLEVWPNPARGFVDCRLSMFDFRGDLSLMIYDFFGREVSEIKVPVSQDQVQIIVESYPPGVYIAVLKSGCDFLGSGKFVVR